DKTQYIVFYLGHQYYIMCFIIHNSEPYLKTFVFDKTLKMRDKWHQFNFKQMFLVTKKFFSEFKVFSFAF
ncbi:hypothetical protein BU120_03925, partial [Staphylococcus xylosus]